MLIISYFQDFVYLGGYISYSDGTCIFSSRSCLFQELNYGSRRLSDKTLINFREVRILP